MVGRCISSWGSFGLGRLLLVSVFFFFSCVCVCVIFYFVLDDISGQMTATSHDVNTPNGGLVREIPWNSQANRKGPIYGVFLKWWYPKKNMSFPTKMIILGCEMGVPPFEEPPNMLWIKSGGKNIAENHASWMWDWKLGRVTQDEFGQKCQLFVWTTLGWLKNTTMMMNLELFWSTVYS